MTNDGDFNAVLCTVTTGADWAGIMGVLGVLLLLLRVLFRLWEALWQLAAAMRSSVLADLFLNDFVAGPCCSLFIFWSVEVCSVCFY